jgi:hypothetical protein
MKKKNLLLSKETIHQLRTTRLADVVGGIIQKSVMGGEGNTCTCNTGDGGGDTNATCQPR